MKFIQAYTGNNALLCGSRTQWEARSSDDAASISTDGDWRRIFSQGEVLARPLL